MRGLASWTVALLALIGLGGCGRQQWPPDDTPVLITDDANFQDVLKELEGLSSRPLAKFEQGEPLSGDELTLVSWAIPKARGLVAYKPDSFGPKIILAKLYRASNAIEKAVQAYEEAFALTPREPNKGQVVVLASGRSDLAGILFGRREFDKAEDQLREALRLEPSNVKYHIQLVQVLLEAKRLDEAKKSLADARRINPQYPGVRAMTKLIQAGASSQGASSSSEPKAEGSP